MISLAPWTCVSIFLLLLNTSISPSNKVAHIVSGLSERSGLLRHSRRLCTAFRYFKSLDPLLKGLIGLKNSR